MKLATLFKTTALVASLGMSSLAFAADIDMNADANDIAISGYDSVAYFTKGKPQKGSDEFMATYKNAIYQFASAENRDMFRRNPEKYAPQYGGYCAMGVALERKLDVDPTAFKIVDNKLYLNLNKAVQKKWLSDEATNIQTAEDNWPDIRRKSDAELSAD